MSNHMRTVCIVLLGAVLALTVALGSVSAQSRQLSPADHKIARALFEAQQGTSTSAPLTMDQIAALKTDTGWGQVFKDMKSRGLLPQKNLGQVVSEFEKRHPETARAERTAKPDKVEKPEKPSKPERMEKPERPEKPGR